MVDDYRLGLLRQKIVTGAKSYYHADGLGSTSRLTDTSENVTDSFKYEAWGNALSLTGATQTLFQFVGSLDYYSDGASGLMMLGVRYYGAGVGRFMSMDPVKNGLNWYRCAASNPVNLSDPSGFFAVTACLASAPCRSFLFCLLGLVGGARYDTLGQIVSGLCCDWCSIGYSTLAGCCAGLVASAGYNYFVREIFEAIFGFIIVGGITGGLCYGICKRVLCRDRKSPDVSNAGGINYAPWMDAYFAWNVNQGNLLRMGNEKDT